MMREIYAIELDDDIPLSNDVISNLKEIAFLTYDELNKYDNHVFCADDDNLIINDLLEVYKEETGTYHYTFLSDKTGTDYRLYEPFLVNGKTFAFTVYKDSIRKEDIEYTITSVLSMLSLKYKFKIMTIDYTGKRIENRFNAIDTLTDQLMPKKVKKRIKLRPHSILSMLKI